MNFKITFSYRIGKMTFDAPKKRKKSVENDDLKEGGGGGDMGGGADTQAQGGGQRTNGGQAARTTSGVPAAVVTQPLKTDSSAVVRAEGSWTYTVESPQGGGGTLVIKKDGERYSGTVTGNRDNREIPLTSVTVKGNGLTYVYEVNFGGNTMTSTGNVVIAGDEMNGTVSMGQFGTFPLKGKRAQ